MKKKTLALCLALVLVLVATVGGTLAWLTDTTEEVVNTFTPSDIDITLEETKDDFKMVPGYTISKDPKVTVLAGSEKCYLFVKLEKSANFDTFLTFTPADGWTQGDTTNGLPTNVFYRVIDEDSEIGIPYSVLANDQVTVKGTVTKSDMNGLTEATYPTLTVTAYASQLYENATDTFTALEAWQNCPGNATTP